MAHLVLKKCPVCRARIKKQAEPSTLCHRCNSELEVVHLAYQKAIYWQHKARLELSEKTVSSAVFSAIQACSFVDCTETRRTLAATLYAANNPMLAQQVLQKT